jgi:hypothetical protein
MAAILRSRTSGGAIGKGCQGVVLFTVPCPTPDGRSARDLYEDRVARITPEMQASAIAHGCTFHRAWCVEDGSAFLAIASWQTLEGARAFYAEWDITDEPGEVLLELEGDIGLVPAG